MSIDAHPPPASVTANGPANRALNMLSEMSTPLSTARASPSLAPFTALEIPPVKPRKVKVPIPASRAVAASKQKEVKDTIAALRAKAQAAPYSTVHPSNTPSRKILSKRQEDEAENTEETFVVEPLKKGKENTKPTPPPGLRSSPGATAAVVSPVEERAQAQTQEAAAAVQPRATTPSIRTAGTLKFPTTSLAGGAPPSGIRVAPSFRPTRETQFRSHAPAARIGGRFTANVDDEDDADEGAPTKEELEKAAKSLPTINVPVGLKLSFGKDEVRYCYLFLFVLVVGLVLMIGYRVPQRHQLRHRGQRRHQHRHRSLCRRSTSSKPLFRQARHQNSKSTPHLLLYLPLHLRSCSLRQLQLPVRKQCLQLSQ
jgi:hypothetical protein